MKLKKLTVAATLAVALCSASVSAEAPKDFAKIQRYAQANKELPAKKPGEKRVVLFGNSITDHWPEKCPEFFEETGYIGRGISGQTSYQFVIRLRPDVIDLDADLVVICAGTNDCAENMGPFVIDNTVGNVKSLVELARANNIKVLLASVLPTSGFYWRKSVTDAPERVIALNKRLKEYADEACVPWVDYYSAMVEGDNGHINPAYSDDGVHPNRYGYQVMQAIVKPAIEAELAR